MQAVSDCTLNHHPFLLKAVAAQMFPWSRCVPIQTSLNSEESLLAIEVLDEALSKQNYLKLTMNTIKHWFSGISTIALQNWVFLIQI